MNETLRPWTPIAVVGVACRLPDADSPAELARLMIDGRIVPREIQADRWDTREFGDPAHAPARSVTRWSGLIDDPYAFDAAFFGVSPAEAPHVDPQQRLVLEESWHCVEDAAIPTAELRAARTAVVISAASRDHLLGPVDWDHVTERSTFGGSDYMLASRVAHQLGLDGPCFSVDAACAGSATAIHLGGRLIHAGEADFALVGGVNLNLNPWRYLSYSQARMLSPTGRCHTFSTDADGFVDCDGVVTLLLRPLDDALVAGDHVHGVIIGSAVNNAGPRRSITSPTVAAQATVVAEALASGGIDPASVDLLLAHGTGTPLGDPIEVSAARRAYAVERERPLRLSSVKAHVGHGESAAGATGVVGALGLIGARTFPAYPIAADPDPLLVLDDRVTLVEDEPEEWPEPADAPRRAAVSSFGAGGSNSHIVVEDAPSPRVGAATMPEEGLPALLSAREPAALEALCAAWREYAQGLSAEDLPDSLSTLATGRDEMAVRCGGVVHDVAGLERVLTPTGGQPAVTAVRTGPRPATVDDASMDALIGHDHPLALACRSTGDEEDRRLLAQCAVTTALLAHLPAAIPLVAAEDGVRVALVATGMLDAEKALDPNPTGLRPPMRTVRLAGAPSWTDPYTVTAAELRHLQGAMASEPEVLHAEIDTALRHAEVNPSVRRDLEAWGRALTEAQLPPVAEHLDRGADEAGLHAAAVAARVVLASLEHRWGIDGTAGADDTALAAYGDLLRDAGVSPEAAIALLTGDSVVPISLRSPLSAQRLLDRRAEEAAGVALQDLAAETEPPAPDELVVAAHATRGAVQEALVRVWLGGGDIDWAAWLPPHRRVSLPTYPFQRKEYRLRPPARRDGSAPAAELSWAEVEWEATAGGDAPRRVLAVGDDIAAALDGVDGITTAPAWTSRGDWATWLQDARDADELPDVVLVSGLADGGERWESDAVGTFRALLQAALTSVPHHVMRVVLLTAPDAAADVSCGRALPPGLARESSRLSATYLEVSGDLAEAALSEIRATDDAPRARYRHGVREAARIRRRPAGGRLGTPRRTGVVLVSGGRGRVGDALARWLARQGMTAVTLGRTPAAAPDELLGRGRLVHRTADVTRVDELAEVVDRLRSEYGPITGVVHAAAVVEDRLLRNLDEAALAATAHAKVGGARHLDEVTAADALDFFVVCSSIATTVGNLGQCGYALANAWLDAFAEQRDRAVAAGSRSGRSRSIQWSWWDGGDLSLDPDHPFVRSGALVPMPDVVGADVFEHALAGGAAVCRPVFGRPAAWESLFDLYQGAVAAADPGADPAVTAADIEPAAAAEAYVRVALGDVLGVEPDELDLGESLDSYGLDSIAVTSFNHRLSEDVGCTEVTLLYEAQHIGDIVERLAAGYGDGVRRWAASAATTPDAPVAAAPSVAGSAEPAAARPAGPAPQERALAVTGLAVRLPHADDLEALSSLVEGEVTAIAPVTRFVVPERTSTTPSGTHPTSCPTGGFLEDVEEFDSQFFAMSPLEAQVTDPQERLLLQTAWHALEDAGLPPGRFGTPGGIGRERVGVFVGATSHTFSLWGPAYWGADAQVFPTSMGWSLANRLSYVLDLHGPSETVDTACSSSLVALHHAARSLRSGECDVALVAGVNLYLHPGKYDYLAHKEMVSPKGRCRPFGEGADGFVPGEGVVCLVLRREEDAQADADRVRARVLGTAVNHGGKVSGFTVPNPRAQAAVIRAALADAGLPPAAVSYVEAHGTGTSLGDPVEARGLAEVFGGTPPAVGAVKGHIGHLEGAAGLVGLAKIVTQFETGRIAATLSSTPLNPAVRAAYREIDVVTEPRPWVPAAGFGLVAGVSSFGAGGVNAHVVLAAPDSAAHASAPRPTREEVVVPLSAASEESLRDLAGALAAWVDRHTPDLGHLAEHLRAHREELTCRAAIVTADPATLVTALRALAADSGHPALVTGRVRRRAVAAEPDPGLRGLASAWVVGGSDLPDHGAVAPLDTPLYPFARERHVLPPVPAPAGGPTPAPVLSATAEWTTSLDPEDPTLDDHRVFTRRIMPAAGIIELVRRAAAECGLPVSQLTKTAFEVPLLVEEHLPVRVVFTAAGEGWDVRVESPTRPDAAATVYATAQAHAGAGPLRGAPAELGGDEVDPHTIYAALRELGLDLGRPYRQIRRVRREGDVVEALVAAVEHDPATWWPATALDACFQASSLFDTSGDLLLPFLVESITVGQPCEGPLRSRVTLRAQVKNARKIDIDVWTESGDLVIRLEGFWVRLLTQDAVAPAHSLQRLVPSWSPVTADASAVLDRVVLVAEPGTGLETQLGATDLRTVPWTTEWQAPVAAQLDGAERAAVVLVPPVGLGQDELADLGPRITRQLPAGASVRVLVVERAAAPSPAARGLAALLRTASDEISRLSAAVIAWDGASPQALGAALAGQVSGLLRAGTEPEALGWGRAAGEPGESALRRRGTYLVTGGHRGIGLALTRWLVDHWEASVVVLGRSPDGLERSGLDPRRVQYVRGDVTDASDVRSAVAAANSVGTGLLGVFHVAGVLQDEAALRLTDAAIEAVRAPKITGWRVLRDETRHLDLDLFCVYSSLADAIPSTYQGAYGQANAWLDGLVAEQSGGRTRMLSVLWPFWAEGGMRMPESAAERLTERFGLTPIGTEDGLAALDAALRYDDPVVAVVPGGAVAALVAPAARADQAACPPAADDGTEGVDVGAAVRDFLRGQVHELSGVAVEKIRLDADIADYGLDSLAFSRLAEACNATLGSDITPATMFEFATVAELADHLVAEYAEPLAAWAGATARLTAPTPEPAPSVVRVDHTRADVPVAPLLRGGGRGRGTDPRHGRRSVRDRRDGRRGTRFAVPGRPVGTPARRRRPHRGDPVGPVGLARGLRPRDGPARDDQQSVGRLPSRRPTLRPRLLRHLPARGRAHGPSAEAVPGDGLSGGGGRRPQPLVPRREPYGRLRRGGLARLLRARPRLEAADRGLQHDRDVPLADRQPRLLPAQPARPELPGRRGVLQLPRRAAHGPRGDALGRLRCRARRWGQPPHLPDRLRLLLPRRDAEPDGPVPDLRRRRRRVRSRRRDRRRPGAPARRRESGRGPRLRRHPRIGRQPRRQGQHAHHPQPAGPGRPHRAGPRGSRHRCHRSRLRRDARDRHSARGSHRGQRARLRAPPAPGRPGRGGAPRGGHRLGEVGARPRRGRRRDDGPLQGAALAAPRDHPGQPARGARERADPACRHRSGHRRHRPAVAHAAGAPAHGRSQLLRLRRDQRPRRPPGAQPGPGRGAAPRRSIRDPPLRQDPRSAGAPGGRPGRGAPGLRVRDERAPRPPRGHRGRRPRLPPRGGASRGELGRPRPDPRRPRRRRDRAARRRRHRGSTRGPGRRRPPSVRRGLHPRARTRPPHPPRGLRRRRPRRAGGGPRRAVVRQAARRDRHPRHRAPGRRGGALRPGLARGRGRRLGDELSGDRPAVGSPDLSVRR